MKYRHAVALSSLIAASHLLAPATLAAQEEVGPDDFRISAMGGSGDNQYSAFQADVGYNSVDHEYLVVWRGDHTTPADEQYEIFGRLVDAATGAVLGAADFQISEMSLSPFGIAFGAFNPAVAHNPHTNEYLVVWSGMDNELPGPYTSFEIWGQLIDGDTGSPVGGDFLISDMGDEDDFQFNARTPAVVYNPIAGEYLVVWSSDDDTGGLVDEELEIFGQRLDGDTLVDVGADDFRISSTGGTGSGFFDANRPAVAYNAVDDEYLVVWDADDGTTPYADNELEIWIQRLDGATGGQLGGDVRISNNGPPGHSGYQAYEAAVAHAPDQNEYLVVWTGTQTFFTSQPNELEIFAQRLDGETGGEVGADDQRITDVGGTNEQIFDAEMPDVAYSFAAHRFLVSFRANDNLGGQVAGEVETFVQAIDAVTGNEVGPNDLRISDMGPNGAQEYDVAFPSIAHDTSTGGFLVVWNSSDDAGGMEPDELEIFGQRLAPASLFRDGFESGDTSAWSTSVP